MHISSLYQVNEPVIFGDDEGLDPQHETAEGNASTKDAGDFNSMRTIEVKTYTEVSAVPKSVCYDNFTMLIHLKAPLTSGRQNRNQNHAESLQSFQYSRALVDLVRILDVSGSISGTKLALLKRANGVCNPECWPT
ncbi:unnamed protein product [Dovyalis caffra]|uniref:Uncharacterized protein n=1 Tax=Dovyalis caffra TaxID=77055 RepID=A0AAV1QZY1_9ROSI|nr:unnamed protein product [Dovyalis caffra]